MRSVSRSISLKSRSPCCHQHAPDALAVDGRGQLGRLLVGRQRRPPAQLDRAARVAGEGHGHLGGDAPRAAGEEDHRLLADAQRRHVDRVGTRRPAVQAHDLAGQPGAVAAAHLGGGAGGRQLLGDEAGDDGGVRDLGLAQVDQADHPVGVLDPRGLHQGPDARALRHRVLERAGRGGLDAHAPAEGGHEHDVGRPLDQQPLEGREHVDHGRAGGVEEVGDHDDAPGQRRLAGARPAPPGPRRRTARPPAPRPPGCRPSR